MLETQLLDALMALGIFIAACWNFALARGGRSSWRTPARMALAAAAFAVLAVGSRSPGLALLSAAGLTWIACFAI